MGLVQMEAFWPRRLEARRFGLRIVSFSELLSGVARRVLQSFRSAAWRPGWHVMDLGTAWHLLHDWLPTTSARRSSPACSRPSVQPVNNRRILQTRNGSIYCQYGPGPGKVVTTVCEPITR